MRNSFNKKAYISAKSRMRTRQFEQAVASIVTGKKCRDVAKMQYVFTVLLLVILSANGSLAFMLAVQSVESIVVCNS